MTLSAAIDQGLTNPDEVVDCQMGAIYIAGHRIRDHKPYRPAHGLANSGEFERRRRDQDRLAPGRAEILRLHSRVRFRQPDGRGPAGRKPRLAAPRGELDAGFGRLDLHGPGSRRDAAADGQRRVGHRQWRIALSAARGAGAANRRRTICFPKHEPDPKRVVRETTAATMRSMLEGVVLDGTGKLARLDGYTAAGKTGTAQKIDPATGRYSATQLIASFVGFAPINNPALTILVQLDSPSMGSHMGGAVAAPVFKRVAEQALAYLNVPQRRSIPAKDACALRAPQQAEDAPTDVADFDPVQIESPGAQELDADPAAPAPPAAAASASPPTVELAEGDGVQLPSLAGKTVRQVTEICQKLGVNPVLVGTGIAQQQQPEAGAMMRRGSSVTIWFGKPPELAQARNQRNQKVAR